MISIIPHRLLHQLTDQCYPCHVRRSKLVALIKTASPGSDPVVASQQSPRQICSNRQHPLLHIHRHPQSTLPIKRCSATFFLTGQNSISSAIDSRCSVWSHRDTVQFWLGSFNIQTRFSFSSVTSIFGRRSGSTFGLQSGSAPDQSGSTSSLYTFCIFYIFLVCKQVWFVSITMRLREVRRPITYKLAHSR